MVRILGIFNPSVRGIHEMMYEWNAPFVVDGSRFERTFGIEATPLQDAIRKTVA